MANIMFQGTASNVGKSIITTGVCRLLVNDGYRVAPFKSQNMSLNSYIDIYGGEMGRAQVIQAEACRITPESRMNPILLKPNKGFGSQLIVNGKLVANMTAEEYRNYKPSLIRELRDAYSYFENNYDVVVLEGAGSPVEININSLDLSNMEMAKIADSPVVLIGDIDRGGVFASIVGSLQLMKDDERKRVKGLIINKFRGEKKSFESGIKMLEELTGVPVLGLIPYIDLKIEEEDGVSERLFSRKKAELKKLSELNNSINIAVIKLQHMSNFTDFNIFEYLDRVNLRFVEEHESIGQKAENGEIVMPDLLIIPGSKDTIADMEYLNESGFADQIRSYEKTGKPIIGICGGYQLLGRSIEDKDALDGGLKNDFINKKGKIEGLSILDVETIFDKDKRTRQINTEFIQSDSYFKNMKGLKIKAYELHFGRTGVDSAFFNIKNGQVMGTYCHGIFDNKDFTITLLNNICEKKNIEKIVLKEDLFDLKDKEYDKLASHIRENIDVDLLYQIIFNK